MSDYNQAATKSNNPMTAAQQAVIASSIKNNLSIKQNSIVHSGRADAAESVNSDASKIPTWYEHQLAHPVVKSIFPNVDLETGELLGAGQFEVDKTDAQQAVSTSRIEGYFLQNTIGEILNNGHRVCKCLKTRVAQKVGISSGSKSSSFVGLMQCGSVWDCPVCTKKISNTRAEELRTAFEAIRKNGWHVTMWTYTIPHRRDQSLKDNVTALTKAYESFWNRKAIKAQRDNEWMIEGRIRSLETTWGINNGWHPHLHVLVVSREPITDFAKRIAHPVWVDCCKRRGLGAPSWENGLTIQDAAHAAEYVNKFADDSKLETKKKWDAADEMTHFHSKRGRGDSLTPFDMVRIINKPEDYEHYGFADSMGVDYVAQFKNLFNEYSNGMFKKRQLTWGSGDWDLKKKLNIEEIDDQEIVEAEGEDSEIKVVLGAGDWSRICSRQRKEKSDYRGAILNTIKHEGTEAACELIYAVVNPKQSYKEWRAYIHKLTINNKDDCYVSKRSAGGVMSDEELNRLSSDSVVNGRRLAAEFVADKKDFSKANRKTTFNIEKTVEQCKQTITHY